MNATLVQPHFAGAAGGLSPSDKTDATAPAGRVGAGALAPAAPQRGDRQSAQVQDFQVPVRSREPVTLRLAEAALNRILSTFGPKDGGEPLTVAQLERTPMEAMNLAASLLGVKALGDNAELKSLALEIRTQGAENLRLRQNEDLRKQIDKSIEDAQKAQKAGIFTAIVDWIVAAAEVVSGVAKIMVGDVAGGAMDFAAGCSGLVKAFAETMALMSDGDTAKKWQEVADIAGKIQLGFEIAGMCVDLISVGRGVMATKSIAKTTETVMEKGAGEALQAAVQTGSKEVIKDCAEGIGKQVAQDVAEQVAKDVAAPLCEKLLVGTFGKEAAREIVKNGTREVIKEALKEAITKMVAEAVEKAAGQAIKDGTQMSVKELTKQVVKEVQRELFEVILKTSTKSTANMAKKNTLEFVQSANGVAQGWIAKERAELQKIIQQLMAESSFMQFMLDEFEKLKKRVREDIGHLLDGAGKALSGASESQLKTGAVLSSIAHNIA